MTQKEYYEDERFCEHCNAYTMHRCCDSGHERDSSNDYKECLICHWYRSGWSDQESLLEN